MRRFFTSAALGGALMVGLTALPAEALDPTTVERPLPARRDTEPVALTGAAFAGWASPSDVSGPEARSRAAATRTRP